MSRLIGSFDAVVMSVEPSLVVALNDGRLLSTVPEELLSDRRPGAGQAQLEALRAPLGGVARQRDNVDTRNAAL